jgi:hypothetical protein
MAVDWRRNVACCHCGKQTESTRRVQHRYEGEMVFVHSQAGLELIRFESNLSWGWQMIWSMGWCSDTRPGVECSFCQGYP